MKTSVKGHENCSDAVSSVKPSWVFILASLTVGGSEKKTVMIANELSARGYDIHLVYLKKPDSLLGHVGNNVKVVMLNRQSRIDVKAVLKLRRYIKNNNISKVWNVNLYPMLYGFLATLFLANRVERVVSVNTTYFPNYKEALQMILYVPVMYQMSKIVFGCAMQKKRWLRLYFLPKKKSSVIYNGVDVDYFKIDVFEDCLKRIRSEYGIKEDEFVIGVVAKLRPEKGHVSIIMAIKKLLYSGCNVKLLFVGDGVERASLESVVTREGVQDNVLFLGDVQDVRKIISIFDVFVLASISVETFSNAALEAMSMSKPVVLSNIGGASEMVEINRNGYLFEPGNVDELVRFLQNLMKTTLREEMSHYARKKVNDEFSFNRMVKCYIDL